MAVAAQANLSFGGMLSQPVDVSGTHVRCDYCGQQAFSQHPGGQGALDQIANFLGVRNASRLFLEATPPIDAVVNRTQDLRQEPGPGATGIVYDTFCHKCALEFNGKALPALTHGFMEALRARVRDPVRARLAGQADVFKPGVPRVAIHIRRGNDVGGMRFTPDSYYFLVVRYIRKIIPTADVHAWSATEGTHSASDFEEYARRNITLHLDGDPMQAWAHLASAHVLVMAKSTFSHIPAMVNPACVIYQPWNYRNPGFWLNQTVSPSPAGLKAAERARRHKFQKQLQQCIADGLAGPLLQEHECEGECAAAATLIAPAPLVRPSSCRPALPS